MSEANVQAGQPVPDFSAPATGGRTVRLSDLKGKWVVLYFYPKDHTPGCTLEGRAFRDHYEAFKQLGAEIFGVSRDSLKTHENFKARQGFPFELISDRDETLCRLFDVIKPKKMFGREYRGIERSTFLIDPEGRLAAEWRKVKVKGHVDEVLARLRALQQAGD
ncbi:thioredoxin-dependent peroxiredoxin [Methylomarinovum caldicuralii]|uniref:thioredoxin-dependent peroxiredoxin n=1 Tax=Methylomarinovum caldicuralii TaxID=438856 RepID=A0AAU9C2F7_9GAMM|nr:peroxiredoxin [Methylomarinovum caldicuralii]BCX82945.1 thioredoxin-dependent peroxiredoxin [Methylomarinovum caldicuralii]